MSLDRGGDVGPKRFQFGDVMTYSGAAARRRGFENVEDAVRAGNSNDGAARIGAAAGAQPLDLLAGVAVEELASIRHHGHRVGRRDGTGKGRVDEGEPPIGVPRPHRRRKRFEESALRLRIGLLPLPPVSKLGIFLLETAYVIDP